MSPGTEDSSIFLQLRWQAVLFSSYQFSTNRQKLAGFERQKPLGSIFIVFPSRTQRNRVWMGVQICVMFLSFPAKHRAAGCFQIDIKRELCCFPSLLPESE